MCGGAQEFRLSCAGEGSVKDRWRLRQGWWWAESLCTRHFQPRWWRWRLFFWKVLASDAPPRTNIIYTPKTDWYLRVLACPSHELAVYTENSLENFVRISCSRKKVVPLFRKSYHFFAYQLFPSPYQLFPLLYQLFPSQGTPSPRTGAASFLCLRNLGI